MCYRDRLTMDKQELLAMKWATDFLIPSRMLLEEMRRKKWFDIRDLIDHFFVTSKFFLQKLEFMAKKKFIWEIDHQRSLFLHGLPSVHIYEKT